MNDLLPSVLGALAVVFTAAVALGVFIHRAYRRRLRGDSPDQHFGGDGMSGSVGFVGGAAAFLLGVLMLASLDHYNSTKGIVADEALAYSAAFDSTEGLDPGDRPKIQRDLVCLMRSVATHSWAAAEAAALTGSPNTHAWRRRTNEQANTIIPKSKGQEDSLNTLQAELIDASKSGQQRLLAAESDLPLALWILVFVSIFVLTSMLTALLLDHPSRTLTLAGLGSVLVLSTAMLWTLTTFDEPFNQGDGVYISPRAINAVLVRLQGTYPNADWGPCEMLADY